MKGENLFSRECLFFNYLNIHITKNLFVVPKS
jgi:hypothetical protein